MALEEAPILRIREGRFGFPDQPDFLGPLSFSVRSGEHWAIVGPNGAGKSTLLRLLAGLHELGAGEVAIKGERLRSIPRRIRAKRLAFVPQHMADGINLTARELVLMGRYPHRSMGLFESREDHECAERAMAITATLPLAERPVATLSGGEARRVHMAAALAQSPEILLLDEPTASLDVRHQLAIFDVLRDRARRFGVAVVVVTHDINLAARYCSHVLLLDHGKGVAAGAPGEVLNPDLLGAVYGVPMASLPSHGGTAGRWIVPVSRGHREETELC